MLSDEVLSAIEERARRANAVRLSGDYVELGVIASVVREDVPALLAEVRRVRRRELADLDRLEIYRRFVMALAEEECEQREDGKTCREREECESWCVPCGADAKVDEAGSIAL